MISTLVFCLAAAAPPQQPSPPTVVDLSFQPPAHRPLLIEGTQEFAGEYTVIVGEKRTQQPAQSKVELQIVDEIQRSDPQNLEATRMFVKAFKVTDGEIQDPPLNGLTTTIKRANGQSAVSLNDGRFLPADQVDALMRLAPSLGLWLVLPKDAQVGNNYVIDLEPVAALLLSNDFERNTGEVNALFESFDPTSGVARLRGFARLEEQGPLQGLECKLVYECDCAIDVCTRESRITAISISGSYTAEGATPDGRVRFDGSGKYKSSFTSRIGDAVSKARQSVPIHRDRIFRADGLGLSFALPSIYGRVDEPGSSYAFQRMRSGKRLAMICVDYLEGDPSNPKKFYDSLLADLKRQFGEVTMVKVWSPLGAGQAFELNRYADGEQVRVRSEVYPLEKKFLLLKLQAAPATLSSTLPDLVTARKSLKRIKT